MSVFPDWQNFAVHQRRQETGCIPTCYEMMMRAAGATGIDFDAFQDEFDLDINLQPGQTPHNNFGSVARAVEAKYSFVKFEQKSFTSSAEKVAFVDERLSKQQPIMISLCQEHQERICCHIMPVVDATDDEYTLLEYVDVNMKRHTKPITKAELARVHDAYEDGHDVAFLAELHEETRR